MQSNPLVSIIIPVFFVERYLSQAIQSVLVSLRQDIEIIIINNGSTDGRTQLAKHFLAQELYYCQENSMIPAEFNQDISLSQGIFITFLDSDSLWMAN